jgi:phosphatidate cytidylyltransferase
VLLSVVIPIVIWGSRSVFLALMALVVALCQLEYEKLVGSSDGLGRRALGTLVALSMPGAAMALGERGLMMALSGSVLLWMVLEVALRRELEGVFRDLGRRMLGYLYGAVLPSYFVLLWRLPDGFHWIFLTMTITAVGDTAAYYAGSLRGRHKLLPRISPNKTIEGSLAGLIGNVAGALAYAAVLFPSQIAPGGLLLALLVGGAGQLGDLSESMLKRAAGLKDSGGLLPGHGGILDRLDSLLFSAPVVYYWVTA